jgi:hypothetical protein
MKYLFIIVMIIVSLSNAYSQCGCMGGAAIGGITPIGGSANLGVLKENNLRSSVFFRNGYGNEYFSKDTKVTPGIVKEYLYDYIGLNAGYGITEDLTVEIESGYFLKKMQDYEFEKLESSGFSHINTSIKYNLYNSYISQIEYTAGIGGRVPLNFSNDEVPQHVLPSTGAYGLILHSFLHKGFKKQGLHFFLINRAEINSENKKNYLYGSSIFSSFYLTQYLLYDLTIMLQIRNEYRTKDHYLGSEVSDSGGSIFNVSPQLSYKADKFYISAMYDYPFYKYYYGKQLSNSYSFSLMLTWQMDFN